MNNLNEIPSPSYQCPGCKKRVEFSAVSASWEEFKLWKDFRGDERKFMCWGEWGKGYWFLHFVVPIGGKSGKRRASHRMVRVKELPGKLLAKIDPDKGIGKRDQI